MNPFHKFRDEHPDKFIGPPILSTNVKFVPQNDFPDVEAANGNLHPYGEMIQKYEHRKRETRKEINPDMKFSMNSHMKKTHSVNPTPQKNKKTFINALQFFYNKINLHESPSVQSRNRLSTKTKPSNNFELKVLPAKETIEDESNTDPNKKKEEAMNFIGEVARNILIKYDFFPKSKIDFLKEGDGVHCSNPSMRDRDVYMSVLKN